MIRAFVGVRIDPRVVAKICDVQAELKPRLSGVRWVVGENLHLTLKFLGGVAEENVTPITESLQRAGASVPRFSIKASGIGVFPDIRRPRVLWVGLESKELAVLAGEIESILEPMGFPREKRDFKPHLTIGRWHTPGAQSDSVRHAIQGWKDCDFGESPVEEVVLFRSVLKPTGAVYSPLHVASLKGNSPA